MKTAWLYLVLGLLLTGCAHTSTTKPEVSFATPKLEVLDQQIANNASDAQAYSNRGYVLALLGRKEAARADLAKALELKDNAPMRNRLGWAYFNQGDYSKALELWESGAKASNYRSHYDYYSLVLGYWGVKDWQRALEHYQLAVEREPRFGEMKTLRERTIEWTPRERQAIEEVYILWSKTWKP
jgi:tetratricopeptide (TPR) repeat protein